MLHTGSKAMGCVIKQKPTQRARAVCVCAYVRASVPRHGAQVGGREQGAARGGQVKLALQLMNLSNHPAQQVHAVLPFSSARISFLKNK